MNNPNHSCNILFVNPPSIPYTYLAESLKDKSLPIAQVIAMPMGILYLSAVLEEQIDDCNIKILDLAKSVRSFSKNKKRQNIDIDDFFFQEISSQEWDNFVPDFIGLSILFSTAHKTSGHIADSLKKLYPNAPIIVGGMHATSAVESLLEIPSVDYVCRGEAESIIVQVAKSAKSNDDLEKIPGIIGGKKLEQSQKNGIKNTESAPLIDDLDEIPYPAWHLLEMSEYVGVDSRARIVEISHD